MSYFTVKNIHKTWESVTVDFSLECEKGTMTCLLGPSGCGKSTVLNIISGLEKNDPDYQTQLEIELDGQRIEKLPPRLRGVGMVFQSGALFNHMNVVNNVAYGLISQGMKKKEALARASAFLPEFGLEDFDRRMPQTLSGGERQRVALARTLITQPKLVLLDEPLSALDADLRQRLAKQIREWQKTMGFTAIMVTHDIAEAEAVADKIVRFSK
ncbi:ABC transporter ATP-binding protein [Treponema bryantii]|uniref:ABC transporter ATP-binding protein n=1 Tax=Treponema bryantii TaxID=163 RepID=UPI0003B2FD2B|nr:ABC transporter ATP-binding protein [Treponema bryantii]